MSDDGLVSTGYLAQRFGVSATTIKSLDRRGLVAPSIRILGSDRRAWRASDIPTIERQIADLMRESGRRTARAA